MTTVETPAITPQRGYSATKDQLQKRLSGIEGQVRHCVAGDTSDQTDEVMAAVARLMRRG